MIMSPRRCYYSVSSGSGLGTPQGRVWCAPSRGTRGVAGWEGGSQGTSSPPPESPAGGGGGRGSISLHCPVAGREAAMGLDAHAAKSRSCSSLSRCRMRAVPFARIASPVPPRAGWTSASPLCKEAADREAAEFCGSWPRVGSNPGLPDSTLQTPAPQPTAAPSSRLEGALRLLDGGPSAEEDSEDSP